MKFTTTDEAGFSFLIERNEYIEDDAPAIVKNAWKKMKQDRRAEFTKSRICRTMISFKTEGYCVGVLQRNAEQRVQLPCICWWIRFDNTVDMA